jgi:hypothetical protein
LEKGNLSEQKNFGGKKIYFAKKFKIPNVGDLLIFLNETLTKRRIEQYRDFHIKKIKNRDFSL